MPRPVLEVDWGVRPLFTALIVTLAVQGCAPRRQAVSTPPSPRQQTLDSIKKLEQELGYAKTENFTRHSQTKEAYFQCYYTGLFELPHSYEGLRMTNGTREGCDVDESRFDVFFYPIEAVAGTETPVTTSLQEASEERFAVVVAHEDFHEMKEIQQLPTRFSEAASTLAGFLTAAEFTRREYGPESDRHRKLAREAEVYLRKSEIINSHHERLLALYTELRRRVITREEAAADKQRLFLELDAACRAITPEPSSFNKCLSVNNNAGLAFDLTYTRFFPMLYEIHLALGEDPQATLDALRQPARNRSISEPEAERLFRRMTNDSSPGSW